MLSRLVVLLLLAKGAWADCACTPLEQPPTPYVAAQWPQFYIQNPMNDSGLPCATTCTYTMDSGDDSKGVGNFKITNWDQDDNLNFISIFNLYTNGINASSPIVDRMTYNNHGSVSFASLTRKVQVVLTMGSGKPVNILATLDRTALGTVAPTATTTPIPTSTTHYPGPFKYDPALISNDVIFMVDAGFNNGNTFDSAKFNETKELAAKIVTSLTNVFTGNLSDAPATSSRLGMSILSQIASGSVTQPWRESASTVADLFRALTPVFARTEYVKSIEPLLKIDNSPFSINNAANVNDPNQNSRPYAQRMLIVVASSVPVDVDAMVALNFTNLDVHPVFIAYQLFPNDQNTMSKLSAAGWAVYNAPNNTDNTVKQFVNQYLLAADQVCPLNYTYLADDSGTFVYPNNYQGANNASDWANTNQTARYCNFHKTQGTIKACTSVERSFTVFYDLEVEKDYLRFFDSNSKEIVSFTGSDVSGSTFKATGDVVFKFETNESQVFGGFQITYTPCS